MCLDARNKRLFWPKQGFETLFPAKILQSGRLIRIMDMHPDECMKVLRFQ